MFAIIETGGKQFRVEEGDRLRLEKLPGSVGDVLEFSNVLYANGPEGIKTGTPYIESATVTGTSLSEGKHRKVLVFKKKRRNQYKRLRGHRQLYTEVRIDKISL